MVYEFFIPTKVLFGAGCLKKLHEQELPGKKALVVITDGGSMIRNGYLDQVQQELTLAGCSSVVYSKVKPNPTKDNVMEGAALGREFGCDFVLGLGGGSSIDAAKAMAAMVVNPGDYWDYINGGSALGKPFVNRPLPVVAVVTTAGTGTESDPWTVVTKEDTKEKIGFGGPTMFPCLSIVDPELMRSVPKMLTAFQGFDALFHSAEGYIHNTVSHVSDMFCEKSLELLGGYLATAVNDGQNMEARSNVGLASTIAGYVQSTSGCVSEHALAHAMGALHPEIPHGAALIAISKAYFSYFAENHVCDDRMIKMAKLLGKADAACAMDFIDALGSLQEQCGVAELKLSEYGFVPEEFQELVDNARSTMGGMFNNDRAVLSDEAIVDMFRKSYR